MTENSHVCLEPLMDTCNETETESEIKTNEAELESKPLSEVETPKPLETRPGVFLLRSWLNKSFRVEMTDGRVLIGIFLCTDRDANIILGSCSEYLPSDSKSKTTNEEPRMLGLVMIPGKHIVSLQLDSSEYESGTQKPLTKEISAEDTL